MHDEIKIVAASAEDAEQFEEIEKICWVETYANEVAGITREDILSRAWGSPARLADKRDMIAGGEGGKMRFWAARSTQGIVGYVGTEQNPDFGELEYIYVLPEYQNKGIGKKLMKTALTWLDPEKDIRVDVVSFNIRAREFYKKFGFEVQTEPGDSSTLPTGKRLERVRMVKKPSIT